MHYIYMLKNKKSLCRLLPLTASWLTNFCLVKLISSSNALLHACYPRKKLAGLKTGGRH